LDALKADTVLGCRLEAAGCRHWKTINVKKREEAGYRLEVQQQRRKLKKHN
jgi:hypothetical protein